MFVRWACVLLVFFLLFTGELYSFPINRGTDLSPVKVCDLDGNAVTLGSLKGKIVLLSFVAFWCDTYREVIEGYRALQGELNGVEVEYVLLFVDQRYASNAAPIIQELSGRDQGIKIFCDPDEHLKDLFSLDTVPTVAIADPSGRVIYSCRGYPSHQVVKEVIFEQQRHTAAAAVRRVFLTFDDFPSGDRDIRLLDILEQYNAKATFFVIGRNAARYPALVKRAALQSHSLQNHSYSHRDLRLCSEETVREELGRCQETVAMLTGRKPLYFRTPGGSVDETVSAIAGSLGLRKSPWDINSADYERPGKRSILGRIAGEMRDGSVILLHAGVSDTLESLPDLLIELNKRGIITEVLR